MARALLVDHEPTVHAQFMRTVSQHPDAEFLCIPLSACSRYSASALSWRYREAAGIVERLRLAYEAARMGPGHRVALLLENRPAFFFHWLALNAVGAGIVPLNPAYRHAELSYVLDHSEASLAVVLDERLEDVRAAAHASGRGIAVLAETEVEEALPRFAPRRGPRGRHAECALLYTSGTTGRPKGCLLDNDYFLRTGLRYMNRRGHVELVVGASRVLTPLPMFHINAMAGSTLGMIFAGGCVIQLDRFHPSTWWQDVVETRATGAHCLGVMPALLLKLPPGPLDRAHALRYCTAANVEPQHHLAFEQRFGVPLIEGWSMTETGAGAAISADHEPRHPGTRCFGRVPPNLELRLVDEQGQDVPPGEPGEMWVRARGENPRLGFFSGYLKDEDATEQGWAGGWWHTGDIARMGPDGSLFFVDRRKSLIRRSGENISALEVEVALREHAAVQEVAVTGVADEVRGEEVFAFIRLAGGRESSAALAREIVDWLGSRLAYYKVPGHIAFVPGLPVTATQKLERGQLKQRAQEHVAAGSGHDLRAVKAGLRHQPHEGERHAAG